MNKHQKLTKCTEEWEKKASEAHTRPGTTPLADDERAKTLRECVKDVKEILDDHKDD